MEISVVFPHEKVDIFGVAFFIQNIVLPHEAELLPVCTIRKALKSIAPIPSLAFDYRKVTIPLISSRICLSAQNQCRILLHSEVFKDSTIGIPICLDNIRKLDRDSIMGNSFVTVVFKSRDLKHLTSQEPYVWSKTLKSKATRIAKILDRRPSIKLEAPDYIFSLSGDFSRVKWNKKISPEYLRMVPTPASKKTANIFIWSFQNSLAIEVCCSNEHLLYPSLSLLCDRWKQYFLSYSRG